MNCMDYFIFINAIIFKNIIILIVENIIKSLFFYFVVDYNR